MRCTRRSHASAIERGHSIAVSATCLIAAVMLFHRSVTIIDKRLSSLMYIITLCAFIISYFIFQKLLEGQYLE